MKPAISIIIPLYNKRGYVGATLDALIAQLGEHDEIVVVDDRSTDDGADLVREKFAAIPGRSRYLLLPKNSGPATARNAGAHQARGAYLLFFDADDIPMPWLLHTLRAAIELHPARAVFAYGIAFQARAEAAPAAPGSGPVPAIVRPQHAFADDNLKGLTLCTASSTCVSRDVFLAQEGGFHPGLRYCEDPEFWVRLSARHAMVQIDACLAIYRDVAGSLSYGLRGQLGSVNPYLGTLAILSARHGQRYTRMARSMLFKNLVFARAAGARRSAARRQLSAYRQALGPATYLVLSCINLLPSKIVRHILDARSRRALPS